MLDIFSFDFYSTYLIYYFFQIKISLTVFTIYDLVRYSCQVYTLSLFAPGAHNLAL